MDFPIESTLKKYVAFVFSCSCTDTLALSRIIRCLLLSVVVDDAVVIPLSLVYRYLALTGSVGSFISKHSCDEVGDKLNHRQVQVCRRNIDVMNSVKMGAEIAVQECQHQFRYRRWNCTTVQFERSPVFGNSVNGGE